MGVDVDEAGGHQLPLGIDLLGAVPGDLADCGNPAVLEPDIRLDRLAAGAIDDGATADDEIELCRHRSSPWALALGHCAPADVVGVKPWWREPVASRAVWDSR